MIGQEEVVEYDAFDDFFRDLRRVRSHLIRPSRLSDPLAKNYAEVRQRHFGPKREKRRGQP
jgi:hypothetical protein